MAVPAASSFSAILSTDRQVAALPMRYTARIGALMRHLSPHRCQDAKSLHAGAVASRSMAPLRSPDGTEYPAGTSISLMGNMQPVSDEVAVSPLKLVFGALPHDLNGCFIRTGPNPYLDNFGKPYHEFLGDGMLHSADLADGTGVYSNRWVRTKRLAMDVAAGRPSGRLAYMEQDGTQKGAANTALIYFAKKLLATFEVDRPYVISAPSLETLGQLNFDGTLKHAMTAHPKVCPETGELIFFNYSLLEAKVNYGVASSDGKMTHSIAVPTCGGKPVMIHDMAITRNYSILTEFPLYLDEKLLAKGAMPFAHDVNAPSMFAILPRHGSIDQVQWFRARSAMSFHCANAWEEVDSIKLIACPSDHFSFNYGESLPSRLYEWTFDLKTGSTTERELDSNHIEFPVINPKMLGRRNRYIFAARFTGGASPFHSISGCVKYDVLTGTCQVHDFLAGRWGGEAVFSPSAAGGDEEDNGFLITYTYNPEKRTTEVYVVDAKTMAKDPVAILETPARVPFGFHGIWLNRSEI